MRDDFAIFILTHGRSENVKTVKTLKNSGYKGKLYLIIDDEDEQEENYRKIYKDKVIVFNKEEARKNTDTFTIIKKAGAVVYARNMCWEIARDLGLEYFLVLDDDYTDFNYRYKEGNKLKSKTIKNINGLIEEIIKWIENTNITVVALAQAGDFIGGAENKNYDKEVLRKAMNSHFLKVDREFKYTGQTNEDVNAYVEQGKLGRLFLTITLASLNQTITQQNKGGLTDIYLQEGTYLKSFYSVITAPDCVKIAMMGDKNPRMHHRVSWNYCVPKILNEKYKKKEITYGENG